MLDVLTVQTPSLGDRSYVVTDGRTAVVVDPQRDIDRVLEVTEPRRLRISHVLETHVHNDYVTGGYALAERVGARYCLSAEDEVAFERHPVRDGEVLRAGSMRLRVLHTPGHTYTHVSYALEGPEGSVEAVFTGGSLLYGSTGRPDLLGQEHTEPLARQQYRSARRLVAELPAAAAIYPTHGFGSFCSATQTRGDSSTIGREAEHNPALTQEEEEFVSQMLAGLGDFPAYYAHMMPANAAGPEAADLSEPAPVDTVELRRRIEAGEWVVDLRDRTAFAVGHMSGTLNFGIDGQFVTYLGWTIPWGTPVTLLAETRGDIEQAQRDMARIGLARPAGAATGSPQEWARGEELGSYRQVRFADVAAARKRGEQPYLLDVRRDDEHRESAVADSVHIPIHRLPLELGKVARDRPVWVHCASGYRASIASSFLAREGYDVITIDDHFDQAAAAGVEMTR